MSSFTTPNYEAINGAGVLAFESSGLLDQLKTDLAATAVPAVNAALEVVKCLSENVGQWIEVYTLELLPFILDNLANSKTAEAAMAAGSAILKKSNAHSIRLITAKLYEAFSSLKWQTKKGALVLVGALAEHHPVVVQRNLPEMILNLILIASDIKKDVKDQCRVTFTQICTTITNVDIIPIIAKVIDGYMDPVKKTETALDALVATAFINDVDLPTLGLLVPILKRGMGEKKVAAKRRAALVIGNMCKLVNDPRTAAVFYPVLKPVLERGIDEIAVEEVRKVCQESLSILQRVSGEADVLSDSVFTCEQLVDCIKETLSKNGIADPTLYVRLVEFMAKTSHFLVLGDNRAKEDWEQCIIPYAQAILAADVVQVFADEVIAAGTAALSPEKKDLEDEEEDLCNAQFSLAYGTRVLLHQTPFRVKIGRKYGLVGVYKGMSFPNSRPNLTKCFPFF